MRWVAYEAASALGICRQVQPVYVFRSTEPAGRSDYNGAAAIEVALGLSCPPPSPLLV
jgi:hypothetical protein